jgi:hypothetical protein
MLRTRLALLSLLTITAACGGDDPADIDDGDLPNGSISARIDGSNWRASAAITASFRQGIFAVAGTDGTNTVGFAVATTAPGTFTIAATANVNALLTVTGSTTGWQAVGTTGSGSLTISTLTANSASGTFSFVLAPLGGTGGNKNVSNGTFNVTF